MLPHQLDPKKRTCRAIIDTPKGRRNKFDYDPDSNLFTLGGLLPEGMMFPFDFGFTPSKLGDDGDPLDVMVLMDAPAHVRCHQRKRLWVASRFRTWQNLSLFYGTTQSNVRWLGRWVEALVALFVRLQPRMSPMLSSREVRCTLAILV